MLLPQVYAQEGADGTRTLATRYGHRLADWVRWSIIHQFPCAVAIIGSKDLPCHHVPCVNAHVSHLEAFIYAIKV